LIAGSVAKRYAQALLDVAMESQAAQAVLRELTQVAALVRAQRELREFLLNPSVRRRDAVQVMDEIASRLQASSLTRTFLRVVLEAGRMTALEGILRTYEVLVDERLGRVRAAVTTTAPLGDEPAARLTAELERLTGKRVLLEVSEDPAILGGVITRIGSRVYDGSLTTQLARLRQELVTGE
jgi:F-type H+-transporting ATPase subunit delta